MVHSFSNSHRTNFNSNYTASLAKIVGKNSGLFLLQLIKGYAQCVNISCTFPRTLTNVPCGNRTHNYSLGEPLNICHLCSPMYRKVAIRQAFFVFRVAPCSSKFTGVVRCSPVHFSSFLDFSKKGNKNIFHLPPILAHFEQKSICSRTASLNRISHISLKCTRWGR